MAYLCGLFGLLSCRSFRSWIGHPIKEAKAEPKPAQLVIGEPYNPVHRLHITDADVEAALAAGDGEIVNMEYLQQYTGVQAVEGEFYVGEVEGQDGEVSTDSLGD